MEEDRLRAQREKEQRLQTGISHRGKGRGRGGGRRGKYHRSKAMDTSQKEENELGDDMDASELGISDRNGDQSTTTTAEHSSSIQNLLVDSNDMKILNKAAKF